QLFVIELVPLFTNEDHPAYRYALDMVREYHAGTFILGGGNVLDIPIITNKLQKISRVPLLINGDLESGMTYAHPWRLSRGWTDRLPRYIAGGGTQFPSQMAIGATLNPAFAFALGRITAIEARAIGIQWSNSPVADVNSNPDNPIINTRSYGEDPALVASMVEAYVRGAQSAGMIATLKHFPGHGDTREDSHMELPSLPFGTGRLDSVELVPFRAGIAAGARAVMTSHLALPRIDPTGRPATLSRPVITGILRTKLGFNGIVVTDGMRMQGITDHFSSAEAAINAIEAGADAVLGIADIDSAFRGVVAAVRTGRIPMERLDLSCRRILGAKEWAGLAKRRTVSIDSIFRIVGSEEFRRTAETISDASVTLLRNQGSIIPLKRTARVTLVTVSEDPQPGIGIDLSEHLEPYVRSASVFRVSNETGRERFGEISADAGGSDVLVVGIYLSVVAWKGDHRFAPPLRDFLDSLGHFPVPVIAVAFGDPYVLGKIPETQVVLTPFNGTNLAEVSVARAITGRIRIGGKSPVTVPGRYRRGEGIVLEARPQ
ncbi:MAG TPA: glycoside hydrolase family 3 protein, partial [Bacteroidota bacterium]|nr:glycoside hydrolase family 3 protein [Bacteroidota bacterium]